MSSTVVVNPAVGLSKIAESLDALRAEAERMRAEGDLDPAFTAAYALISRDLFDLASKSRAMAWSSVPNPEDHAGLLRVNELKFADQVKLMAKMARLLVAYVSEHGGQIKMAWAVEAVARRMYTTQDEVYYGLTYAEAEGLLERSERGMDLRLPSFSE